MDQVFWSAHRLVVDRQECQSFFASKVIGHEKHKELKYGFPIF